MKKAVKIEYLYLDLNTCSRCCGTDVTCRVFTYEGADYEVPPKAMLAEEILRRVLPGQFRKLRRNPMPCPRI